MSTRASEFVATYAPQGVRAWEKAAFDVFAGEGPVPWPLSPFTCESPDKSIKLTLRACTDYLALGDQASGDIMRMPLTPGMMQKVADLWDMILPTTRIARSIYAASPNRVSPETRWPNKEYLKGPDGGLPQFLEQSRAIDKQIAKAGFTTGLTSGQKKDIVVGNAMKPGSLTHGGVLIYGWPKLSAAIPAEDQPLMVTKPWRWQEYSPIHDANYVDYSHGGRLVHPLAELPDGSTAEILELLKDPRYRAALTDEIPPDLMKLRYPYPGDRITRSAGYPGQSFADRGLDVTRDRKLDQVASR
jgi:hypothetical protein